MRILHNLAPSTIKVRVPQTRPIAPSRLKTVRMGIIKIVILVRHVIRWGIKRMVAVRTQIPPAVVYATSHAGTALFQMATSRQIPARYIIPRHVRIIPRIRFVIPDII